MPPFKLEPTVHQSGPRKRDVQRFASLFTPDGCFGTHQGREAIAAMLERFHVGGERFEWQFLEPVCTELKMAGLTQRPL